MRLREVTKDRWPKPLVPVPIGNQSFPFLEFVLGHLSQQGILDFIFCIGHLGHQIIEHFGDGSRFGLTFRYDDAGEVETGSRVQSAARLVSGAEFMVTCGDVFLPLDVGRFLSNFDERPEWQVLLAAVCAHSDADPNIAFDPDGAVTAHGKIHNKGAQVGLEAGTLMVRQSAFEAIGTGASFSLTQDLFPELIRQGTLGSTIAETVFFDIGTPPGYRRFCDFAAKGGARPLRRITASGLEDES